ncbi:MAG: signal peptidase II [Puniceicoccales bacterium]|nr:signal peptidase II [Puniceicoccales bacterium]
MTREFRGLCVACSIAFISLSVDQLAKAFAARELGRNGAIWCRFLLLRYCENSGAAFGMLAGFRWFFCATAAAVLLLGIFFYRRLALWRPTNCICFGLIGGGILGNLWDRISIGFVVDFICLPLRPFDGVSFNVADCALCLGVGIHIFDSILLHWRRSESTRR